MEELCDAEGVDLHELLSKVQDGLAGVSIQHFTDAELRVIQVALEVAGGL